jgi:hypothetical protein
MQEENGIKKYMNNIGFFDQNKVDKAEVKDGTNKAEEIKKFLEKRNIESARVILTNYSNRMITTHILVVSERSATTKLYLYFNTHSSLILNVTRRLTKIKHQSIESNIKVGEFVWNL